MTPARSPDPAAEAVSALREADERTAICSALGCIDKPGVPLKFVQDLQRRLAESYKRNDELIRSWDRASPTERQELDRMRRGWGPSSPTERVRRQVDVAACVQALGGALTELSVPEEDADDVPEEAQAYLDTAHDRVEKAYTAAIAVSDAIREEPDEWPDIKAAEERGALAAEADIAALRTRVEAAEKLITAAIGEVDPSLDGHGVWSGSLVEAIAATNADRDRLAEENARLREGLSEIAQATPEPDDKAWRAGPFDDPEPYRCRGPDGQTYSTTTKDGHADDMEDFGYERGLHAAAVIARRALTATGGTTDAAI